jgi:ATP-binding cassette, subfamily B, bacterial MsbA
VTVRTELRLLRLVVPYRGLLALGLVTTFLASVLDGFTLVILIPLLKHLFGTTGQLRAGSTQLEAFVSRVTEPLVAGLSNGQAAGRLVVVLVVGLLLKNVLSYASSQISVGVQEGLVRDLRTRIFDHLLTLELGYFQRTRAGQLISGIITEVDQTKTVITASLLSLFQNLVIVATTLVVLSQISLRLTLLTLACVPIMVLLLQSLLTRLRRNSRARTQERGEVTATIAERVGAVRLIRAYGEEARESARFASQANRYRKQVIRTQRFSSLTSPLTEVFSGFLVILIIWAGTRPALIGLGAPLAPEAIIVFLMAALKLTSPLKTISSYPAVMAVTLASAERVFEMLDEPSTEVDRPGEAAARFEREVVFERVSFRYGDGDPVLSEVSFTLPKGKVVALVGPSGAGKTTLADLLPRFHDPTAGQITMDGVPLTRLTRRSLRALMGVVSQDTVLLNDTVHANIAYGSPTATRQQVEAAAHAANADLFIAQLPLGYDTLLGERGTRLSGGQRQRIAIARALLRDPPILVLDEATSALDTESERLVQQAIDRLMAERTVLVIAHRLATVRDADEIVVLDAGRVVERGTHEQLFRTGGLYRRLYDLQFRDQEPALAAPV